MDVVVRDRNLEQIARLAPPDPRVELGRLVAAHERVLGELTARVTDAHYRAWWLTQARQTLRRLREEIAKL